AAHGVLGAAAVRRWAEAGIAPGAGPGPRRRHIQRIDARVVLRLLVADQRAVGRARAVDAVLPADLPEGLVADEEGEVDAGVAGRLDVGALRPRPVFVMADRQEHFVVADQVAVAVAVDV